MSSRVDSTDPPPGEDYSPLIEYAARYGMPYQRVYDWVGWGQVAGVRHGVRWAVTFPRRIRY